MEPWIVAVLAVSALVVGGAVGFLIGRAQRPNTTLESALREALAERAASDQRAAAAADRNAEQRAEFERVLQHERVASHEQLTGLRDETGRLRDLSAELETELRQSVALRATSEANAASVAAALEEQRAEFERRLRDERAQAEAQQSASASALAEMRSDADRRVTEERTRAAKELADERARAQQELANERTRTAEQLQALREDEARLANEFAALSQRALARNTEAFLAQADERLKRSQDEGVAALKQREEAVRQLVQPLTESLQAVKGEVTAAERARLEANSALLEQLSAMRTSSESLQQETKQLVTALRAPQVRGRWGELQLRRVVEAAGMLPHVDFTEQAHTVTDDGVLRPDLVVTLPGDKHVVVDAKVAFSGYLEAMEARDETHRAERMRAHARHMRDHIDQLGGKAYWDAVSGTPEFVVMFVPAEPFLNAALEVEPTLFERAFERNVVLATPATLVALLRTVAYTWRQEQLAGEAQQVFAAGKELHKRLGTLGGHLTTLGKRLNATVEAYNAFGASLDRNVVTQARRFSRIQGLEPTIEHPEPLEVLAVPASKPDLFDDPAQRDEERTEAEPAPGTTEDGSPED